MENVAFIPPGHGLDALLAERLTLETPILGMTCCRIGEHQG
jgi:hypothetical protein